MAWSRKYSQEVSGINGLEEFGEEEALTPKLFYSGPKRGCLSGRNNDRREQLARRTVLPFGVIPPGIPSHMNAKDSAPDWGRFFNSQSIERDVTEPLVADLSGWKPCYIAVHSCSDWLDF